MIDYSPCANGCSRWVEEDGSTREVPVSAEDGLLCRWCAKRLHGWLDDLHDRYSRLSANKLPGSVDVNPETKATKQPYAPAPVRLNVLDLLDDRPDGNGGFRGVLGVLWPYSALLRAHIFAEISRPDVYSEVNILRSPETLRQEWVSSFYNDLRNLHREIGDAVGDYRPRPVGICGVLDDQGAECGGKLMPRDNGSVACVSCRSLWLPHDLQRLGLVLGGAA